MPDRDTEGGRGTSGIEVAFARFEGAVTAELRNLTHDVKGVLASLNAYATTRDLNAAEERMEARRTADAQRLEKVEKNQSFLARTIATAAIGALVTGAGWALNLLLKVAHP